MTAAEILLSKSPLSGGKASVVLQSITINPSGTIVPIAIRENPFSFNKQSNRFFDDNLKVEVYAIKLIKHFIEQREELPFKIKYVSSKFMIRN